MREHEIQRACVLYLRVKGWFTICTDVMAALGYIVGNKRFAFINHYKGIGYTKGQPDLVAFKNKRVIFIEFKRGKAKRTIEQEFLGDELLKAKQLYLVIRSIDELDNWLKELE